MAKVDSLKKYLSLIRKATINVPHTVSLEVTNRCQLRCIYCKQDKGRPEDLRFEKLQIVKRQLPGIKRLIVCGIGEGFCYPDIYKVADVFEKIPITIFTNGAIPIDFPKLTATGSKLLVFSIDATTPDLMEEICPNYNFQVLIDNLNKLRQYPQIIRTINTTINQYNLDEFVNLIRFAARYHLYAVSFKLPLNNYQFVQENRVLINRRIEEAIKAGNKYNVFVDQFTNLSCVYEDSIILMIGLNGDVYPCCHGMDTGIVIGNIFKQNINELWNDDVRSLIKDKLCNECEQIRNLVAVTNE